MDKRQIDKSKTYSELLRNEMTILMSIKHSRCMQTIELCEDNRFYYMVTEIIEGGPIINRLKALNGPFCEEQAKYICK
jgi:serine/threonine protein kinase